MPNIKQNLDSITVVGFTIYDEKESVRQLEQDQKVPLSYIGAEINLVCRKRRFRLVL